MDEGNVEPVDRVVNCGKALSLAHLAPFVVRAPVSHEFCSFANAFLATIVNGFLSGQRVA